MKRYVDGFVLVVPKKNLAAYKKMATWAAKLWMKWGALQYVETVAEDMKVMQGALPFPKLTKAKPSEVVVFSWIMFKNRKHRDAVNKKVMADPKMNEMMEMPFEMSKTSYGGFETIVNL